MVMGPTPPGTGVIQEARSAQGVERESGELLRLAGEIKSKIDEIS